MSYAELMLATSGLILIPIFILIAYFYYFRKLVRAGIEFPGESSRTVKVVVNPNSREVVKVCGKTTIMVNGGQGWISIRVNGGPVQRVFKIRLIRTCGEIELINESRIFKLKVTVITERKEETS